MKKIFTYAACAALLIAGVCACQSETEDAQPAQPVAPVTYPMSFDARLLDFDATSTRAATDWPDGAVIYLCLHNGSSYVTGTANYQQRDDSWSFTPTDIDAPLRSDAEGTCDAYYFAPHRVSGSTVTVGTDVATYETTDGAFMVDDYAPEEGRPRLIVRATLTPKTGRIRLVGTAGQTYSVTGLQTVKSFTVRNNALHTYAFSTDAVSITCGANGSASYAHVAFPEGSRTLRIQHTSKSYFERSFAAGVLRAGTSGYVTIPTVAAPGNWTLKNSGGQTISAVQPSAVTIQSKSYRSATVSATVESGNGEVTEAGFIFSTRSIGDSDFSRSDVKKVAATGSTLTATLSPLTETTTYYVRAYAANELGRRLGKEVSFTTEEKPDGTTFDREEFGGETGWD